jgi:hypothetical protein
MVWTKGAQQAMSITVSGRTVKAKDREGIVQLAVDIATDGERPSFRHLQVDDRAAVLVVPLMVEEHTVRHSPQLRTVE